MHFLHIGDRPLKCEGGLIMWMKVLGAFLAFIGVILLYDARRFVKKYFNYGEENMAVLGFKILGIVLALLGGFLVWLG